MPDTNFILAPDVTTFNIALEPALNAVGSLRLLTWGKDLSGVSEWVTRTLASMTAEQVHDHELVFMGLYYVVDPDRSFPNFKAYVDYLATESPVVLRDKMLDTYLDLCCIKEHIPADEVPTKAELLASKETYLNFLERAFPGPLFNAAIEAEAYDLINDLPRMQQTIVNHMRMMWDEYLAEEWLRVRPMLQESVDAFRQVDFSGMSKVEAVQFVTGQPANEKLEGLLENYKHIIFLPSAHLGPYKGHFYSEDTIWIMYGARLPAGMRSGSSALTRTELLVRLNALADDTRLRIVALIAKEGEMCARDIINALDLSQSAASRHLKQLSATGYLTERRQENAKCYSLNEERWSDTVDALKQFIKP